jgi:hypothetical protein
LRHFQTFKHGFWNGRSCPASCHCPEYSSRETQDPQAENAAPRPWPRPRVQGRLHKVENQLDRFRAKEFWDRVMQEMPELLAERGAMSPVEILPELRAVTMRGASLHKEHLTPVTLKKKMDVRVFHGRYFEPRDATPTRPAEGQACAIWARLDASSSLRNGLVSRGRSAATPSFSA